MRTALIALLLLAFTPQTSPAVEYVGTVPCGDTVRAFVDGISAIAPCHAIAIRLSLRNATSARTNDLVAQNASAYEYSRNLFIGVAAGAIILALLLGFVLSWSVIGPIQSIDYRLTAIASDFFSGHVNVTFLD